MNQDKPSKRVDIKRQVLQRIEETERRAATVFEEQAVCITLDHLNKNVIEPLQKEVENLTESHKAMELVLTSKHNLNGIVDQHFQPIGQDQIQKLKDLYDQTDEQKELESMYYIQTPGFNGDALLWWRPNQCGYTIDLNQAGKYGKEEAASICSPKGSENVAHLCSKVDQLPKGIMRIAHADYLHLSDAEIN